MYYLSQSINLLGLVISVLFKPKCHYTIIYEQRETLTDVLLKTCLEKFVTVHKKALVSLIKLQPEGVFLYKVRFHNDQFLIARIIAVKESCILSSFT